MIIQTDEKLGAWLATAILFAAPCILMARAPAAETLPAAIHPDRRASPSPTGMFPITINPPALLWPAADLGRGDRQSEYRVQLSQDVSFPAGRTISAERLPWAMMNPHQPLRPGVWHWRYGVARRGEHPSWSPTLSFVVPPAARRRPSPTSAAMIAAIPSAHPRVLLAPDQLDEVRRRSKDSPQAAQLIRQARSAIGGRLPDPERGQPTETGSNSDQASDFARWASKAYGNEVSAPVQTLTRAYLLSGERTIGQEAVRRGLFIADLDPDGVTSRNVSDFADGRCLEAMALVYDSCHELLTAAQRERLRSGIEARAQRLYRVSANRLETRVFSAHIWQHILMQFAEASLATLGEIPDAEQWLAYVYELWIARFPLLGGEDGGWANGVNYFGTNFNTLLDLPALFQRHVDAKLDDHVWYRNAVYYLLYSWPPGSRSDGFGDGAERGGEPSNSAGFFVESLAARFDDRYGLWYADQVIDDRQREDPPLSVWWRQLIDERAPRRVAPQSPDELPLARAFRDIGVAALHTDLTDASHNLMVAFRSSPYGCVNHMHACQNSFNVLVGGERLFANSGYYIAYGDEHFRGWYKHTRGHNTVLIDGQGQTFGAEGYGWIAQHLQGRTISYCAGDATAAYGQAGLTRFRRQLVLIRPSTLVVYDDLAADHPADWSWLLHSKAEIALDKTRSRLETSVTGGRGQVDLFGSLPLELSVSDQFDPPALNWRKRTSGGQVIHYPNQWHLTAKPQKKINAMRYLAVIQACPSAKPVRFFEPEATARGAVRVGNWLIEAELDGSRPARLTVADSQGQSALSTGGSSVRVSDRLYAPSQPDASLLVEVVNGRPEVLECQDELPAAAR